MSSPWPKEMRDKFGPALTQVVMKVRHAASRMEVRRLVQGYGLTTEEIDLVLAQIPHAVPETLQGHRSPRGLFSFVCWYMGASYRTLANVYGISHQAVSQSVKARQRLHKGVCLPHRYNMTTDQVAYLWREYMAQPILWEYQPQDLYNTLEGILNASKG